MIELNPQVATGMDPTAFSLRRVSGRWSLSRWSSNFQLPSTLHRRAEDYAGLGELQFESLFAWLAGMH
jgi:hypothetical protein